MVGELSAKNFNDELADDHSKYFVFKKRSVKQISGCRPKMFSAAWRSDTLFVKQKGRQGVQCRLNKIYVCEVKRTNFSMNTKDSLNDLWSASSGAEVTISVF